MPLLEAMAADVPVLAYASTAVPDTLGGAGVQFAPEGSRGRRRAARRAGLRRRRCGPASSPASAGVSPTSATRASAGLASWSPAVLFAWRYGHTESIVRIAFIVQRYGAEILGGSEYHCRLIAERLAAATTSTCSPPARATTSPGRTSIRRATTASGRHRAPLRRRRARATSTPSTSTRDWIFHHPHSRDDELKWLEMQGPWSPGAASTT